MQAPRSSCHTELSLLANKFAPTPCGSGACPRCRRRGLPAIPRYRSSRTSSLLPLVGAVLARDAGAAVFLPYRVIAPREQVRSYPLWERCLPAMQAPRSSCHTALSLLANKFAPTPCGSGACPRCRRRGLPAIPRYLPSRTSSLLPRVGAVLARDKGDAVFLPHRVIVPREQVRSYPLWERCLPAIRATRSIRRTASSFIASKLAPTGERRNLLERGLPAMNDDAVFQLSSEQMPPKGH